MANPVGSLLSLSAFVSRFRLNRLYSRQHPQKNHWVPTRLLSQYILSIGLNFQKRKFLMMRRKRGLFEPPGDGLRKKRRIILDSSFSVGQGFLRTYFFTEEKCHSGLTKKDLPADPQNWAPENFKKNLVCFFWRSESASFFVYIRSLWKDFFGKKQNFMCCFFCTINEGVRNFLGISVLPVNNLCLDKKHQIPLKLVKEKGFFFFCSMSTENSLLFPILNPPKLFFFDCRVCDVVCFRISRNKE